MVGPTRAPLLVLGLLVACGERVFLCSDDTQCDGGYCELSGFCSFEDLECPSGRRYGELAAGGLAGACVSVGDTDGDATTTGTVTSSTSMPTTTTVDATATDTTGRDPVTTSPFTTTPDTDEDSSADGPVTTDSGPEESSSGGTPSESTGEPFEIAVSFGDRFDADFQDVVEDTSLVSYATGDNMGLHGDLHLDGNAFGAWQVALVRFDVSALPDGARIVAASLRLSSFDIVDPGEIDVHRLTEAWAEGDGDQVPGVSNWIERLENTPWTTEGAGDGTYDPTVLATFAFDVPKSQFDIDLPASVIELWHADPSSNFGLLLRTNDLAQPLYFPSSETGVETQRPLLVVRYVP